MLSVVSCNVYPGPAHIEFMLRNLAAQTYREFELVIVDGYYEENAALVTELSQALGLIRVRHTPACEARHVGRYCHWELYNNALMLATEPWVLFFGVHRYLHRGSVQLTVGQASSGLCTVFHQTHAEEPGAIETIEERNGMHLAATASGGLPQSGFFAAPKGVLIHQLNGVNEALLMHHWVDCDLGARALHLPLRSGVVHNGLLRLRHTGGYTYCNPRFGRMHCMEADNYNCIGFLINRLQAYRRIEQPVQRFTANGFEWVRCPKCGGFGLEDSNAYMGHLIDPAYVLAPVNVYGVGRNLARLEDDLKGLDLAAQVDILIASHDNPRYLQ